MRPAFAALLACALLAPAVTQATVRDARDQQEPAPTMQLQSAYPVIVTPKLAESRDFYVEHFGYMVVFEATWFIYLESAGEHPDAIAFMSTDHPSRPPGPEAFGGKGMFLTLQVADATAEFQRLKRAGLDIAYPLTDEAWGQRRFGLHDPSGMWVDVVQQIEPAPGYWDPYLSSR